MKAAAIDIGSNAIRLVIGGLDEKKRIQIYRKLREPIRLGKDAFSKEKMISAENLGLALKAFERFKKIINDQKISVVRAVATSAIREAQNGPEFADVISKTYGIKVDVIDGIEEAKLIQKAVNYEVPVSNLCSLLVDIGGGSVEITLSDAGKILSMESLPLGTVRLLKLLEKSEQSADKLGEIIDETLQATSKKIQDLKKKNPIDICVGTGGNVECLGVIRANYFSKNSISKIYYDELDKLIKKMATLSYKERIEKWNLRPDRADVVYPAALVLKAALKLADMQTLHIPRVGLKDGILLDLLNQ